MSSRVVLLYNQRSTLKLHHVLCSLIPEYEVLDRGWDTLIFMKRLVFSKQLSEVYFDSFILYTEIIFSNQRKSHEHQITGTEELYFISNYYD
jgi:hypothetical protein